MAGQIIARGERTWMVRVYIGRDPQTGRRTNENKTIHGTKKDAERYRNAAVRERDLGNLGHSADTNISVLLNDLLLDYKVNGKSQYWAALVVRVHLLPFFGGMKASAVGTDQIQGYIAARQQPVERTLPNGTERSLQPAKNATINRELALLRRAFNLGRRATPAKVTVAPYIPTLSENNVRKGFFEHDAFIRVRQALPEEICPVITFAYYTGCRRGKSSSFDGIRSTYPSGLCAWSPVRLRTTEAAQSSWLPSCATCSSCKNRFAIAIFQSASGCSRGPETRFATSRGLGQPRVRMPGLSMGKVNRKSCSTIFDGRACVTSPVLACRNRWR